MLSIIVPVYNEAASLRRLYEELHWAYAYLPGAGGQSQISNLKSQMNSVEFIFVDDGSSDGSWGIIADIASRDPRVVAVRLRRNCGKATAYAAGLVRAHGDIIATMDADLQDDPRELQRMLSALEGGDAEMISPHPASLGSESLWLERRGRLRGGGTDEQTMMLAATHTDSTPSNSPSSGGGETDAVDLVVGWKHHRQDTRLKVITSHWYNALLRRVAGTTLHDHNSGFRVMRRAVADAIPLRGDLHRVIPAIAATQGFRVAEVPVRHRARPYGLSKYGHTGLRRAFHGIADLATVAFLMRYRSRPFHFFGGWGLVLLAIGIAINAYLTILWLGGASIGRRPLLLLGILCVVVGVQLIATGFLADLLISHGPREEPPVAEVRRHDTGA